MTATTLHCCKADEVEADCAAATIVSSAPSGIRSGQVRALLLTQSQRSPAAPDIPTATEAGQPELLVTPWFGIFAPAGTPDAVLTQLNKALGDALRDPVVEARTRELGVEVAGGSREALGSFIAADTAKWGEIIKARNIVAD